MALFNAGYPATYQPIVYPSYNPQAYSAPSQSQNSGTQTGIIWVSGEAGAKAYIVAPNTTVQLWDSEAQTIYLKSADASGMPSMKVLDYTIRDAVQNAPTAVSAVQTDYATKSDLEALRGQIEGLKMRIGKLSKKEAEE